MGLAVWSENVIVHQEIVWFPPHVAKAKANDPRRYTRYGAYAAAVEDTLSQWAITHVFIEGYGYANKHTLAVLVELGSLIRQVLHESEARWYEVPPGTLKKFVTGSGVAKKDQMTLSIYKRFGVDCSSHDEADAVGLCYFGAAYLGHPVKVPEAQLKVARELDKRK